jgi:hypothetical protein
MHPVSFIICDSGTDLIVAFAVCDPNDQSNVESLLVLRTPEYEPHLEALERGASISFRSEEEGSRRDLLRAVLYNLDESVITLKGDNRTYDLDISKVDRSEIDAMTETFRQINFDSSIRMSGESDRGTLDEIDDEVDGWGLRPSGERPFVAPEDQGRLRGLMTEAVLSAAGVPIFFVTAACLPYLRVDYPSRVPLTPWETAVFLWLPLLLVALAFGCLIWFITIQLRMAELRRGAGDDAKDG